MEVEHTITTKTEIMEEKKKIIVEPRGLAWPPTELITTTNDEKKGDHDFDLKHHSIQDGGLITEVTCKPSSDKTALTLPTGLNDVWVSTGEEKSKHYKPMPMIPVDEDISKNKAAQEWCLNVLPLSEEQKQKLISDLETDRIRDENAKARKNTLKVPPKIGPEDPELLKHKKQRLSVKEKKSKSS